MLTIEMNANPKRRWYQFSLRTLFAAIVLLSIGFGWWANRAREWIRQRHEAIGTILVIAPPKLGEKPPIAPGGLWPFGEQGVAIIEFDQQISDQNFDRATDLFPEADVTYPAPSGGGIF